MNKFLCIHGHFYQPPRENAWLEEIEIQDSAVPFHDWNQRITSECYRSNAASRILNGPGKIVDIVNNYSKMSFNVGPTLMSWMEKNAEDVYAAILKADRLSMEHFGGHGSAMAQVYNHIIMPLANDRDRITQVIWGLEDFRSRFGREAQGMWLSETAVNTECLEVLAEYGVKYTLLAPRQAKRFRKIGSQEWQEGIDTKRHYQCNLPSGRSIILFFYDGDRSQDVAFKGILKNGREFADHLVNSFDDRKEPQLVHIATDGESYGHHHRHGDMALAFCCRHIESNALARLTNYSQYLELVDVEYEVEILEDTSWSCYHGVERWQGDCGCGNESGYHQKWRAPLRKSLNWLRDQLEEVFISEMKPYHPDPWKLRNEYIQVILNRNREFVNKFLDTHCSPSLSQQDRTEIIRLLEMQRHSMLMFTSCGWFFDEVSRIETVQILQYANRAIQLAERESDAQLSKKFEKRLSKAVSNLPERKDAAHIYREEICPKRISLTSVGMHYAVASLFDESPEHLNILNYACRSDQFERHHAGSQILAIGRTHISSNVTYSEKRLSFAVLYLGQHHIIGSASNISQEGYEDMRMDIVRAFRSGRIYQVMDIMKQYFSGSSFSFFELFKDTRTEVLNKILKSNMEDAARAYRSIYNRSYNLLNVMKSANLQAHPMLRRNMEMVLNFELHEVLADGKTDLKKVRRVVEEIKKWEIPLEKSTLAFEATNKLNHIFQKFAEDPTVTKPLVDLTLLLALLREIEIPFGLNKLQDQMFHLGQELLPTWAKSEEAPDTSLMELFLKLAEDVNLELTTDSTVKSRP